MTCNISVRAPRVCASPEPAALNLPSPPKLALDDAFFASLDSSVRDLAEAESLPPRCYTDPAFYAFETEAVFNHEWLCVGRESWLAEPGDYFTTRIVGEPIVVARTRKGELKAMSSVCQHRGMLVPFGVMNECRALNYGNCRIPCLNCIGRRPLEGPAL